MFLIGFLLIKNKIKEVVDPSIIEYNQIVIITL